jgi:XisI protein
LRAEPDDSGYFRLFWIQRDGTEHGIARELVEAGVTKDRIVLAFRSLEMRRMTDFAVA